MYALASGLVGFPSSSLRVRVLRSDDRYVWVVTADLLDAGTPLTLNVSQVETEQGEAGVRHRTGFVTMEG